MANTSNFRQSLVKSLLISPLLTSIGHFPPAVGSSWVALGIRSNDFDVLILFWTIHMLIDSLFCPLVCDRCKLNMTTGGDKWKDLPRASRPAAKNYLPMVLGLASFTIYNTYLCGFRTSIQLVWFIALEVLWSGPFCPTYSRKRGLHFIKLKEVVSFLS